MLVSLPGEDNPNDYEITDDSGKKRGAGQVVVPIILRRRGPEPDEKVWGTGFFIANGVLVTAAHVLADLNEQTDGVPGKQVASAEIILRTLNDEFVTTHLVTGNIFPEADIAVAQVDVSKGWLNPSLTLNKKLPEVGDKVFTYAYPKSEIVIEKGVKRQIF